MSVDERILDALEKLKEGLIGGSPVLETKTQSNLPRGFSAEMREVTGFNLSSNNGVIKCE